MFAAITRGFALGVVALSVAAAPVLAGPKAVITPAEIDLGVILENNLIERYIEIENAGDGVLVLEDIKTSCGCTAAAVEGVVELTAGQSQKVAITFNSKNMDGDVKKQVSVTTNDEERPTQTIMLKANVHRPIRWEPKYLGLNKVGAQDGWSGVASLQADPALGLEVTNAFILGGRSRKAPTKLFDLGTATESTEADRDVHQWNVTLKDGVKPQKINETLVVVTNQPAPNDTLRYFIRGEVAGRIDFSPNFAVLRMVDSGKETTRDITFRAREGEFKILSATVAESPVKVEVISGETGRDATVRLSYTGEEPGTNGMKRLIVKTDDPHQAEIEIPVRYQTRAEAANASSPNRAKGSVGP